jgi:hypothetical protein
MLHKEKQVTSLMLHTFLAYFFPCKGIILKQYDVFVRKCMNAQYCNESGTLQELEVVKNQT